VVFDNNYPATVGMEDAEKISNPGVNFAISQLDKKLAIEGRPVIEEADEIVFNMWNLKQQQYRFEFVPNNMSAQGLDAILVDKYLRTSTPVSMSENTAVNFTVDANPASGAADRFKIVLAKAKPVTIAKAGIAVSPNPVEGGAANLRFTAQDAGKYSVRILSVTGQVVLTKVVAHPGGNSTQVLNLQGLTTGNYQAEIISPAKTKTVQQLLVK
jgi:Secretion system C-terminal sorting domain